VAVQLIGFCPGSAEVSDGPVAAQPVTSSATAMHGRNISAGAVFLAEQCIDIDLGSEPVLEFLSWHKAALFGAKVRGFCNQPATVLTRDIQPAGFVHGPDPRSLLSWR